MSNADRMVLAYLIGVALGDGNLSNPNGRAVRLRISCATTYPQIAREIEQSIRHLLPANKVSVVKKWTRECVDISVYSNKLTDWMPWRAGQGSKMLQNARVPVWIRESKNYAKPCAKRRGAKNDTHATTV